jgi:uncharacterized membrane protein YcaP (DUF421 family)
MLWFDTPLLETVIRGSVVYLALFTILRVVLKRQSGTVSVSDLLLVVLIADASQGAIADDYRSLPDGILLVTVVIFWSYAIDWLGFHFPALQRIFFPPPLPLVRNGNMLRRNMRQELITEAELMTTLRHQGIERIEQVKLACMEGDGRISVVTVDEEQHLGTEPRTV